MIADKLPQHTVQTADAAGIGVAATSVMGWIPWPTLVLVATLVYTVLRIAELPITVRIYRWVVSKLRRP
ncbi:MAG: hypothetical protein ACRD0K_26880 [Egibacteraceae bacterium]